MKDQKVIVIDNYDSFTYNLVHAIELMLEKRIDVRRNDQITLEEIEPYDVIILSPGPGVPDEAGLLKEIIKKYAPTKKILGVCLGQQAIGEVFGAKLKNLSKVYHGVATNMKRTDAETKVLSNISETFEAGRYHSWSIDKSTLPDCLIPTCYDEQGELMGIRHKDYNIEAVQFHPESVLTPDGYKMIENFLQS